MIDSDGCVIEREVARGLAREVIDGYACVIGQRQQSEKLGNRRVRDGRPLRNRRHVVVNVSVCLTRRPS